MIIEIEYIINDNSKYDSYNIYEAESADFGNEIGILSACSNDKNEAIHKLKCKIQDLIDSFFSMMKVDFDYEIIMTEV